MENSNLPLVVSVDCVSRCNRDDCHKKLLSLYCVLCLFSDHLLDMMERDY